jgi:Cdc6-like AAA superfamily ATPase
MTKNEGTEEKPKSIPRRLSVNARKLLNAPDGVRIQYINGGTFIMYKIVGEIGMELLDLYEQPVRPRMEGMLIFSPTGNGKSTMILRFIDIHSKKLEANLLYVETPERSTLKEFYAEILDRMGYPVKGMRTISTGELRRKILWGFEKKKVKMMFVDEIQNLLDSRRDHKKDVLNGLKSLNNRSMIPIILIGTDTADQVLDLDDQVRDRYPPFEIPLWNNDDEFRDLLATFESELPLKKASNLHKDKIADRIHELSGGKIGRVAYIIRKCGKRAIRSKKEQITLELINSIKWRWNDDGKGR